MLLIIQSTTVAVDNETDATLSSHAKLAYKGRMKNCAPFRFPFRSSLKKPALPPHFCCFSSQPPPPATITITHRSKTRTVGDDRIVFRQRRIPQRASQEFLPNRTGFVFHNLTTLRGQSLDSYRTVTADTAVKGNGGNGRGSNLTFHLFCSTLGQINGAADIPEPVASRTLRA